MPDIRTLLADATERRSPHPDPVSAVHTAVRHRTVRRSAATMTAALATLAVVLFAVAAVSHYTAAEPAAPPRPSPNQRFGWPDYPEPPGVTSLREFADAHSDVVLYLDTNYRSDGTTTTWSVRVLFAGGNNVATWRAELDRRAQGVAWTAVHCPYSRARYERIATEAQSFHWPSGATLSARFAPRFHGQECYVDVPLGVQYVKAADLAAARGKWGQAVRLYNEVGIPAGQESGYYKALSEAPPPPTPEP